MKALLALAFLAGSSLQAQSISQYAGNYILRDGTVLAIAEWEIDPGAPHVLVFTNLRSGRFGVLTGAGTDTFRLQAGVMAGATAATLAFTRAGNAVVNVRLSPPGGIAKIAKRVRSRNESLTIDVRGQTLGATLLLPDGPGPFPAVVVVPAGALGRTAAATFPNFFLGERFAVLIYDRRPARDGDTFDTYAGDAISAVEVLRLRTDIQPSRVGLWGHSQGGWIAMLAASKSPSVAFVIDHSGMMLPAWQQDLYRLAAEAASDGVPAADIREALDFENAMYEVGRTGMGWDSLAARMRVSAAASWMGLVYKPGSLRELRDVWMNDFSYDPIPSASRVRQPVLALFGGLDRSTPIESAGNLANAMRRNARLSISFFPTADHAFFDATTGGNAEIPTLSRFAPGMFEVIRRWLRTR